MIHRMLPITMSESLKSLTIFIICPVLMAIKEQILTTFYKNISKKTSFTNVYFSTFQRMKNYLNVLQCRMYYPAVTKILALVFREHDIIFAPKTTKNLKSLLGSNKDDIPMLKKSGIYEVSCQNGCDAV